MDGFSWTNGYLLPWLLYNKDKKRGRIMFCQKCGTENSDDSMFCKKCGNPFHPEQKSEKREESKRWEVWKRQYDLISFIGCLTMIISLFLPLFQVKFWGTEYSVCLIEGDGQILIVLFSLVILMLFLKAKVLFYVFSAISFALVFWELKNFISSKEEISQFIVLKSGFYLLAIGLILLVIGIVLKIKDAYNRKKINADVISLSNEGKDLSDSNTVSSTKSISNKSDKVLEKDQGFGNRTMQTLSRMDCGGYIAILLVIGYSVWGRGVTVISMMAVTIAAVVVAFITDLICQKLTFDEKKNIKEGLNRRRFNQDGKLTNEKLANLVKVLSSKRYGVSKENGTVVITSGECKYYLSQNADDTFFLQIKELNKKTRINKVLKEHREIADAIQRQCRNSKNSFDDASRSFIEIAKTNKLEFIEIIMAVIMVVIMCYSCLWNVEPKNSLENQFDSVVQMSSEENDKGIDINTNEPDSSNSTETTPVAVPTDVPTEMPNPTPTVKPTPTATPTPTVASVDTSICGIYEYLDAYWDDEWGKMVQNGYGRIEVFVDGNDLYAYMYYLNNPMGNGVPDFEVTKKLVPTGKKGEYLTEDQEMYLTFKGNTVALEYYMASGDMDHVYDKVDY